MPNKSPVEFIRSEVSDKLALWDRIAAACEGQDTIKALKDTILPRPNAADTSAENNARYEAYLKRAVWYNVSARTLNGLAGYVFQKEPTVNLPADLKPLETNVDGSGVTLLQQAKAALRSVIAFGRGGLLVDYPSTDGPTTKQDLLDGNIAPTIVLYGPKAIINWKTSHEGARTFLDLLVLQETFSSEGQDGFTVVNQLQYRVLRRVQSPLGVTGEIWRANDAGEFSNQIDLSFIVTDKNGVGLSEIPFAFLGAINNDSEVDTPPLADLVNLNIAHFLNSADYEEASFMVGQPTPWVSGLTDTWVKDVLKGSMHLGSRAVIPLPVGGAAGLLQASPNTMPFEGMQHKEHQMVALGAKLVEQSSVQRTATEAGMDHSSEMSTLVSAATNVFLAYKLALKFASQFTGAKDAKVEFELSEPLTRENITPQEATSIMGLWMGGLIDFEEARTVLKEAGIAWKEDDLVKQAATDQGLNQPSNNTPQGNGNQTSNPVTGV